MIPHFISFEDFDGLSQSPSLYDKTTQTSEIFERDSTGYLQLKHKSRKTIKGCEINEKSNPIVKESSSLTILKTVLSERYNYCQEVLRPFLNKFSNNYVEAKDDSVVVAADKNIGNARSCKIICPEEKAMSPRETNDRSRCRQRNEPEASCSVSAECPDEPLETDTCCCCNNEPPCVQRPKCPPPMTECEKKPNVCDKTMKEANECKLKKCITKCVRDTVKTIKRDQSHCETVIGYIPSRNPSDKTVFYPFNRLKERGSLDCPLKKSSVQEKLESSSATLGNMSGAVGSFICKMYNKTREVVGLAATNSCKHLGLTNDEAHAQDSESSESCCKRSKKKKCSATKCLFESNEDTRAELTDNKIDDVGTSTDILQTATQMVEQIYVKVSQSFSSLGDSFRMENLLDVVTFPKPDKSSAYDVPTPPPTPPKVAHIPAPTPPKQLSQEQITPVHSGVVKTVANKICSIFRYGRKGSAASVVSEQGNKEKEGGNEEGFEIPDECET